MARSALPPSPFNFDFSNPSTFSLADFTMAGDAKFHGAFFDLTANEYRAGINNSVGRVSYAYPVQLRDNATGEVASFATAFSFAINVKNEYKGDGMAFFLGRYPLAPALPPNSRGGSLGLCAHCTVNKTAGQDRFVAVEFDTYSNNWDPDVTDDHMGIDVDSVVSVANISLPSLSLNGRMSARVEYNGSTGVMNAELHFNGKQMFLPGTTPTFNLTTKVDLGTMFPEQVAIGFSAATGTFIEFHQVLSWSFSLISPWRSSPSSGPWSLNPQIIVTMVT
jgi:hypothetical protein